MPKSHNGRIAPGSLYIDKKHPLTPGQWERLGPDLRVRWLIETHLDREPPSDELMADVHEHLGKTTLPRHIVRTR